MSRLRSLSRQIHSEAWAIRNERRDYERLERQERAMLRASTRQPLRPATPQPTQPSLMARTITTLRRWFRSK